ncbi:Flap endonuclease GEN 1 [Fulvia fulva]|nr:Flap endonuclease GEN 1 [Fulvia fulva]WPV13579.1 Flap endonuclease GEN 1 [Fulvia fulva]WPV28591.1 Flap endonuclease GEN 1 [Fulvia fulva]
MGIHGIFKEIGPGQRVSLVKFSSDHLIAHNRPFRLAIDISIWLFQILASKGGSNPALRTFYYRLLRLLSLNIHPLFVFDGPNKPTFKRNKKVGGPGVRVASVPEFLAKQLLKQFGFPWHIAPGEAEAECALLQREGIVDAVLSEDVDTLMFGSGVTLKNWSSEGTSKVPTHVNVYRAEETKEKSGMDREGMILVALMSGGDYITEGIPGCGPKLACDAARAGFGKDLCEVARMKDKEGLNAWRERLQHQIVTNEAKYFSRKNSKLVIPDEFPNQEVLGYYTHPCISTPEKLERVRDSLQWDQSIDFAALRSFAADAFDWRCLGGAKKFIRNLAPAMLVREMRLQSDGVQVSQEAQAVREKDFIIAIHGKRIHKTTDAEVEYRMSFIPMSLVPIDLTIEDKDDDFIPAGGVEDPSDVESEFAPIPNSTADEDDAPTSPTKKRVARPYEPDQPEKIWMMHSFLELGCPLTVEDYEASLRDPKELFKARRKARAATAGDTNMHAKKTTRKKKTVDSAQLPMAAFTTVMKSSQQEVVIVSSQEDRAPLQASKTGANARAKKTKLDPRDDEDDTDDVIDKVSGFKRPSQLSPSLMKQFDPLEDDDETPKASRLADPPIDKTRIFAPFASKALAQAKAKTTTKARSKQQADPQKTPRHLKRSSDEVISPAMSQRTINSYFSPTPRKQLNFIDLISPAPVTASPPRATTPTPPRTTAQLGTDLLDLAENASWSPGKLPGSVTKRRKKAPLKRHLTAPVQGRDDDLLLPTATSRPGTPDLLDVGIGQAGTRHDTIEALDLTESSPARTTRPPKNAARADSHSMPRPSEEPPVRLSPERSSAPPATIPPLNPPASKPTKAKAKATSSRASSSRSSTNPDPVIRRSPRQQEAKKKRIQLRESLQGSWKEVDVEAVDLTEDGSGWSQSQGRTKIKGWRKSGVEVLDLTGA